MFPQSYRNTSTIVKKRLDYVSVFTDEVTTVDTIRTQTWIHRLVSVHLSRHNVWREIVP